MSSLPDALAGIYATYAERVAIRGAVTLTFAQLRDAAAAAAELIVRESGRPGDRVLLALWSTPQSRVLELGILGHGFVRVAVSPRLHAREVAEIAVDCDAAVVFCETSAHEDVTQALVAAGSRARVVDAARVPLVGPPSSGPPTGLADPTDTAMIIYSSGSTGTPKGAIVTHAAWLDQTERSLGAMPPIEAGDVVLAVGQVPHFGGSIALNCAFGGATTVFREQFDPAAVIAAVEAETVSYLPLAAIMVERLADELGGRTLPSLKAVPYGGSAIREAALLRSAPSFPGVLYQYYGLAEALAPLACLTASDHDRGLSGDALAAVRLRSAGRWLPGAEPRVTDGELLVRGSVVMPGYYNRPDRAVDAEGWFATGDLVEFDDAGYLFVTDRIKDIIISGGYNVHPSEVERVISALPEIADVVVIGTPSETWGEGVTAIVVLRSPVDDLLDYLARAVKNRLASYKKPVAVHVVAEIPRNAAGKPNRRLLRSMFANASPRDPSPPPAS